eukprot:14980184-Alexandrium_andersonii.AAC.1
MSWACAWSGSSLTLGALTARSPPAAAGFLRQAAAFAASAAGFFGSCSEGSLSASPPLLSLRDSCLASWSFNTAGLALGRSETQIGGQFAIQT